MRLVAAACHHHRAGSAQLRMWLRPCPRTEGLVHPVHVACCARRGHPCRRTHRDTVTPRVRLRHAHARLRHPLLPHLPPHVSQLPHHRPLMARSRPVTPRRTPARREDGQSKGAGLHVEGMGFQGGSLHIFRHMATPRQIKCLRGMYGPAMYHLTSLGIQKCIFQVHGPK